MTLDTIPSIAKEIIEKAHKVNSDTATVITLEGDLGAGKTTLTQEISRKLKVKENVNSPTFVIMKKYGIIDKKFKQLIHIDAYRFNSSEQLLKLRWQELLSDKNNLIIIEWPENVPECIPKDALKVKLSHIDDNTRTVEF